MTPLLYVVLGVVVLVLLWTIGVFNGLISLRNRMRAAWGDVDAMLKRRADLIPNLVEAVRGYAGHEQRTFERVTEARSTVLETRGGPEGAAARAEAETVLSRRVGQLVALAEDYPDLRASANFLELQDELTRTENDIAHARRYYNAVIRDLNTFRETFPNLLIAGPLGFRPGEYFELPDPAERAAPRVSEQSPAEEAGRAESEEESES